MLRTVIRRETSGRQLTFSDYNELGIHFFDHRAYDLAVAAFKRAVDAAVFPLAALDINLGAAYLARGMGAQARTWLEKGLSIEPDNQKGRCLLAHTFKQAGLASEALAELKRAYALDPGSPEGRGAELAAEAHSRRVLELALPARRHCPRLYQEVRSRHQRPLSGAAGS